MKDLSIENKITLWNAINRYVEACGGKTGRNNIIAREKIVVEIEKVVEDIINQNDETN